MNNYYKPRSIQNKPPDITLIESNVYPSIYFAKNSETTPFSKCCNAPVYLELSENGCGKILCNSAECRTQVLTEFLINFDDGEQLWKEKVIFQDALEKDKHMRNRISKMIITGRYRHKNLTREIKRTSKEIALLFQSPLDKYDAKNDYFSVAYPPLQEQNFRKAVSRDDEPSFITDVRRSPRRTKYNNFYQDQNDMTVNDNSISHHQNTFDRSNASGQVSINQLEQFKIQMSHGLVLESDIFNKDFEETTNISKTNGFNMSAKNSFPFNQTNYSKDQQRNNHLQPFNANNYSNHNNNNNRKSNTPSPFS